MHINFDHSLITLLLPHRPPFLMVDSVTFYSGGKNPVLGADYTVTGKGPLYPSADTHHRCPSIYIIEGLGQCCNLMIVMWALEKKLLEAGLKFNSIVEVLDKLVNDKPDEITGILKSVLTQRQMEPYSSIGFVGSADMEVTGHACYGQVVTYETQLNQAFGTLFYSTVKAFTNNNPITRGTMVSATKKN